MRSERLGGADPDADEASPAVAAASLLGSSRRRLSLRLGLPLLQLPMVRTALPPSIRSTAASHASTPRDFGRADQLTTAWGGAAAEYARELGRPRRTSRLFLLLGGAAGLFGCVLYLQAWVLDQRAPPLDDSPPRGSTAHWASDEWHRHHTRGPLRQLWRAVVALLRWLRFFSLSPRHFALLALALSVYLFAVNSLGLSSLDVLLALRGRPRRDRRDLSR